MVINQYNDANCEASKIHEQDIFLADGKCHAIEFSKSFYKASCPTTSGGGYQFTVCDDPACTQCTSASVLEAGTYISKSFNVPAGTPSCSKSIDSLNVNVFCTVLSRELSRSSGGNFSTSTPKRNDANQVSFSFISFISLLLAPLIA